MTKADHLPAKARKIRQADALGSRLRMVHVRVALVRPHRAADAKIAGAIIACGAGQDLEERTVSHDNQSSQGKASARRRLIQGAFGMPAVLTLNSGAMAAMNSHMLSIHRQVLENNEPAVTSGAVPIDPITNRPLDFVRVRTYKVTNNGGSQVRRYVRIAEVTSVRKSADIYIDPPLQSNQWIRVDNGQLFVDGNIGWSGSTPATLTAGNYNDSGDVRWAAVRVDGDLTAGFTIKGVVPGSSTAGGAISASAWASSNPNWWV